MGFRGTQIAALIGLLVSVYAVYVEIQAHTPGARALCDIGKGMSCTRVLTSQWARMFFGIPNTYLGILFYVAHFLAPFIPIPFRRELVLLATLVATSFSFYLIYVLYYILEDFCIVCVSTHIVNFTLLVLSFRDWKRGAPQSKKTRVQ